MCQIGECAYSAMVPNATVPDASERLGEFEIMVTRYVKTNRHSKKKKERRFKQEQSVTILLVIYEKTLPSMR